MHELNYVARGTRHAQSRNLISHFGAVPVQFDTAFPKLLDDVLNKMDLPPCALIRKGTGKHQRVNNKAIREVEVPPITPTTWAILK